MAENTNITTASKALASPDRTPVTLRGRLVTKIRDERYVFADSSGQIEVEIERGHLGAAVVNEQTTVELVGTTDKPLGHKAAVEVESMRVIE